MTVTEFTEFKVAIPARYASSRLPGKPLRLLAGRPLLQHVFEQAQISGASEIVIATEDERVQQVAQAFGADVCMTSAAHATGTDRLAEVARQRDWPDDAIVVNLQGDEPRMPAALLRQVAQGLQHHAEAGIATLCTPLQDTADVFDPNIVKTVLDSRGYALYFSRAPIPYHRETFAKPAVARLPPASRYLRHLGLYAYRVAVLRRYPQLPPAMIEQTELLEQLRALWHGIRIYVEEAWEMPPLGIDTEADLARVQAELCR